MVNTYISTNGDVWLIIKIQDIALLVVSCRGVRIFYKVKDGIFTDGEKTLVTTTQGYLVTSDGNIFVTSSRHEKPSGYLLLEDGYSYLLEDGFKFLLEGADIATGILTEDDEQILMEDGDPILLED